MIEKPTDKKTKMVIVRLIYEFPKETKGGIAPNAYYLSKFQRQEGHEVHIFTFDDYEHEENVNGIPVYYIKKPKLVRIFGGKKFFKEIRKRKLNPDIIHGMAAIPFGWLFNWNKKLLNAKYALSIHSPIEDYSGVQVETGYKKLINFLAKNSDLILPIADFIKEELINNGVNDDKIQVIRPGIDYNLFQGKKIIHDKFTVLYVGRFSRIKGLEYLINAIAELKDEDIELNLIGGSEKDNDYERIINLLNKLNLKNKIKILKPIAYHELPKIYHSADIFVLPSVIEAHGKVIQEAQASGLPVITTNQGGAREFIIENENGLLVPIRDSKAISRAILQIKEDQNLAQKLEKNGRESAGKNDWKFVAQKYSKAFKNLCA